MGDFNKNMKKMMRYEWIKHFAAEELTGLIRELGISYPWEMDSLSKVVTREKREEEFQDLMRSLEKGMATSEHQQILFEAINDLDPAIKACVHDKIRKVIYPFV